MAIQLSIEILDNGYNQETNTSTATVLVNANYSAGSHNRNAAGTLYINGVSYSFTASINGMEQEYGYETIYSQTVAIDRSATDLVSCSATVNAGGTSGTINASNSLTLSSDASGGDSPEGGGGAEEEDEKYTFVFNCTLGIGATVKIKQLTSSNARHEFTESNSWSITSYARFWHVFADNVFPNDCSLVFKVIDKNGRECEIITGSSGTYARLDQQGTYQIYAAAVPKSVVRIDAGAELASFASHIDNGESWDLYAPYIDNGESWDLCK
jgi:hypothetical protein